MSDLAKIVGQRIRNYRTQLGLSQEKLAELSGCHPTYIGQLERGEKNATLESIDKVASSLKISLSKLFENLGGESTNERNIPLECYEFLLTKSQEEQEQIIKILIEMDKYKGNKSIDEKALCHGRELYIFKLCFSAIYSIFLSPLKRIRRCRHRFCRCWF